METLFNPKSTVIIGASNSPFNLGATICNILKYLKYHGEIYAVNRAGEDVHGCRGYKSVKEVPIPPDLAVILTSAALVPAFAAECGEAGVKYLIIESAGFSEDGGDGDRYQRELDETVKKYGIRYIGPNCLGTINTHNNFINFYGMVPGMYDVVFQNPGKNSFVVQSGGIGALIIDSFQTDIVNVNKMVSIGNKADLDESDFIEYFDSDETTEVIGLYLENIRDGKKLMLAAKNAKKPVLAFKVGRTKEGAAAALSHTSGMANNDKIFDSACRQSGIIRLKSVSELYSLPKIFTEMPLLKGNRIAIVTNSGAFGGITSDILSESNFAVAKFSDELKQRLAATGKIYNSSNPVDLGPTMSIKIFEDVFEILLSSDEIDGILAIPNVWRPVILDAIMDLISKCKKYEKPASIYIPNSIERIISIRKERVIPVFESPEQAVRALAVSLQHYKFQSVKDER